MAQEDGRVLLLGLGACVLLATLILMTMSLSGIYLEQRRLQRLADQVASLAASEVDDQFYYQVGVTEGVPIRIDQSGARSRATDYLSHLDSRLTPGLRNISLTAFRYQRTRIELELNAVGRVPIVLPLISNLTEVSLTAKSVAGMKSSTG